MKPGPPAKAGPAPPAEADGNCGRSGRGSLQGVVVRKLISCGTRTRTGRAVKRGGTTGAASHFGPCALFFVFFIPFWDPFLKGNTGIFRNIEGVWQKNREYSGIYRVFLEEDEKNIRKEYRGCSKRITYKGQGVVCADAAGQSGDLSVQ